MPAETSSTTDLCFLAEKNEIARYGEAIRILSQQLTLQTIRIHGHLLVIDVEVHVAHVIVHLFRLVHLAVAAGLVFRRHQV